jgi:hypothetical protein
MRNGYNSNEYDILLRVTVQSSIDNNFSEKLLLRFAEDSYTPSSIALGTDFKIRIITQSGYRIRFQAWNIDHHYKGIRNNPYANFYKRTNAAILVVDAANLEANKKQDEQFFNNMERTYPENCEKIVAVDYSNCKEGIKTKELSDLKARFPGAKIVQINTKAAIGVEKLFYDIARSHVKEAHSKASKASSSTETSASQDPIVAQLKATITNRDLENFKDNLKIFLIEEIRRLGSGDKHDRFDLLLNERFSNYNLEETLKFANQVKEVASIRRTPEDASAFRKITSMIAEFLSHYSSMFETTSKAKLNKIEAKYTDLITSQTQNQTKDRQP